MAFESKYLGVIDCSRCSNYTGNSAKIKEFDNYLDRLIEDSFKEIKYGRRDFSKFPRPSERVNDAGMLSYVRMGMDVSLEVTLCTKVKFIFSWNSNEFLHSASIDSSDRYKPVTWEEFEKVVRNKDFINQNLILFVDALNRCVIEYYDKTDSVCTAFIKCYKNTNNTLKEAMTMLIKDGYSKKDVLNAVVTVLADIKWEE